MKRAFDPSGIMNPGKIIDCPPMTENLRFGAEYTAAPMETTLDFSGEGGYGGAVEMCNGMGACRKMTGSMCPSYMVTREEEHSTRGRANLLRAVLSGTLPEDSMASKRLHDALDLCLECKACKAECQTGVDMAKLKYEFLDHYQKSNGVPIRSRLFANINRLSSLSSRLGPLSNLAVGNPLARLFLHRVIGIHPNRVLPPQASQTFPKWFRSRPARANEAVKQVVLFNDTFMNYNYPQVGKAAVAILEQAGYSVVPANPVCCGRPMISKGLLAQAASNARRNVDLLYSYAAQGISIVGCEPSCLLTLKDEYPQLVDDEKARVVAENSYMIDEFLMTLHGEGKLDLRFSNLEKQVMFHGHCHQKALLGTRHSMDLLRLPPGYRVEEINAGCCGMAGSFGYEVEHYGVSMDIGRMEVFPAVEAKDNSWEVAVMGVSCRQQIEHGTGRRSRHLVEVLQDALVG
jgi:Fe-S oxidoreductase